MRTFPFISTTHALIVLRVTVALLLAAHGVIRWYAGTVTGFGGFLSSQGIPAGIAIAWFLTLFEILGGLLMAAGFFVRWIALVWMIELLAGILLVHARQGWFVVGYQTGGVEYSVLLLVVLLTVAAANRK